MQPDTIQKGPVFEGQYRPYFYQSGLFLAYNMPGNPGTPGLPATGSAGYDFSSEHRPWMPSGRPQTVEQIISQGYFPIRESESETAIISDKKQTSGLGLADIIQQVRQRYEIYERNIYQIELGKCYTLSSMFTVEAHRGGVPPNSREAYSLNKSLGEFYEQERDERVRLWQDVSRLKQTLPELAQQYLSAHRKVSILEDDSDGDVP